MSETEKSKVQIRSRPALGDRPAIERNGIAIKAMTEGRVIQVLSKVSDGDVAADIAERLPDHLPLAIRALAPGQWLLVGEQACSDADMDALCHALQPTAEVVDQTHGRVRISVKGPSVERMLAKGTAVDLAHVAFPVGHATTTLFGHIAAHITRTDTDTFELLVLRSFAESFWDDLDLMSREFA